MKAIYLVMCLTILSADATLDQLFNKGGHGSDGNNPIQRIFSKFGGGGGQGRVVNQGHSGKQTSLHDFMHGHSHKAGCDGWIPMMTPAGHSSGAVASVDTSYGVPKHPQDSYGPPAQITPPPQQYGPPPSPPHQEYGPPPTPIHHPPPHQEYGPPPTPIHHPPPHQEYGPPPSAPIHHPPPPPPPHKEYGPPPTPAYHPPPPQKQYGPPLPQPQKQYGPPPPIPIQAYGPPKDFRPGKVIAPVSSYGPPKHVAVKENVGHAEYGVPKIQQVHPPIPQKNYGPPIAQPQKQYGPPHQHTIPPPQSHSHISIQQPQQNYGVPDIQSSYGPPPSGHAGGDNHIIHGNSDISDQDVRQSFDSGVGLVTSSLGVSAGDHNEVIQSHAVHESHTSEVTNSGGLSNDYNGGDSYSAPPLDSYAPGKYEPSFLKPKGQQGPPQQQVHHHKPAPPAKHYLPQKQISPRPLPPQRPPPALYGAPNPQVQPPKHIRPQAPPPSFRPQPQQQQGHGHGHGPVQHGSFRQQPKQPLPHRPPVPHGLFQSIGKHVQSLDLGHKGGSPNFNGGHGHGSSSSSSSYNLNNNQLQNVRIIHDCPKHPSNSYGAPPADSYGPPSQHIEKPASSYGTPIGKPLEHYEPPQALTQNYEIPQFNLEAPQHNSVDFNSPSNSYGPPPSGPALDVIGLESQQRGNSFDINQHHGLATSASSHSISTLPGLDSGFISSGLEFAGATQSHTIQLPPNGGPVPNFKIDILSTIAEQNSNAVDGDNHQQILSEGLLDSVIDAIEKQKAEPQVTEDLQTDHSEVQVFLNSPQGQVVLADQPAASTSVEKSS